MHNKKHYNCLLIHQRCSNFWQYHTKKHVLVIYTKDILNVCTYFDLNKFVFITIKSACKQYFYFLQRPAAHFGGWHTRGAIQDNLVNSCCSGWLGDNIFVCLLLFSGQFPSQNTDRQWSIVLIISDQRLIFYFILPRCPVSLSTIRPNKLHKYIKINIYINTYIHT